MENGVNVPYVTAQNNANSKVIATSRDGLKAGYKQPVQFRAKS